MKQFNISILLFSVILFALCASHIPLPAEGKHIKCDDLVSVITVDYGGFFGKNVLQLRTTNV